MRVNLSAIAPLVLLGAGVASAASSWSFDDATVSIVSKKGGDGSKDKLNAKSPLTKTITLGAFDTAKILLTAKDNGKAKRPHQAFLLLQDETHNVEAPFPLSLKESGKGTVSISHKDLPAQLLTSTQPLKASIVIGSFGSSEGLIAPAFNLDIKLDANAPLPAAPKQVRYGKLPELSHTYRADPQSPYKVISLTFVLAVLATLPVLGLSWVSLGGNLNHLSKALGAAPLSHAAFFGSIVAMEGVFFLYYSALNLFQVLPIIGVISAVAILSGRKALGEVQSRRLAGER